MPQARAYTHIEGWHHTTTALNPNLQNQNPLGPQKWTRGVCDARVKPVMSEPHK